MSNSEQTVMQPQAVSDLELAFPAKVDHLMPAWDDIPDKFKGFHGTRWNEIFADWFYRGLGKAEFIPKKGIDTQQAVRHLRAILVSFEPKHEHKEAACAYLLSLWFKDVKYDKT